jgi:hypothetical protein
MVAEGGAEGGGPGAARPENGFDGGDVEFACVVGFGERAANGAEGCAGREVEEDLGDAGGGEAVVPDALGGAAAVDFDAGL